MNLDEKLSARYKFSTTSYEKEQEIKYSRIIKITRIPYSREDIFAFGLLCEKIEYKVPQISFFLKKVALVFSNIIIFVDKRGAIINVYSHEQIQKKWQKIKASVLNDHKGEEIDSFVQVVDSVVNDKKALIAFLESDAMYGLFFNKKWEQLSHTCNASPSKVFNEIIVDDLPHYKFLYKGTFLKEVKKRNSNQLYEVLCQGLII
ncbi:hypothetical protein [Capnocytophaga stomatis]|uniref:Uncharacterized protein n=1 Tax=Capnocytophaga stomatis TaxID=1848904 RepID=A0A250FYR2_9FLAO|nr:hypothetical protein [Capnocytophaga stomatis]ATA90309.1 hypothetical protein CGC58_11555 [Capnocytophaga stomatis]GIJ94233.1 hypothetical protein CAPN002_14510 [Capnocytophaga stomatis]GIJ97880.1 hypothetical protein CAPN001_24490 [Capnocytophaga stomatis]